MADKIVQALVNRWLVIGAAIVAAIVFVHWFVVLPVPVALARGESAFFVEILFWPALGAEGLWFQRLELGLMAVTGIAACSLALIITLKAVQSAAIRYLAAALALASLATAYFFFAATHDVYRQLIGWSWGNEWRALLDFVFYLLDLVAPLFLIRFFRAYPRSITDEQFLQNYREYMAEQRAKMTQGWRKRVFPQRAGDPDEPNKVERFLWRGTPQQRMAQWQRFWVSSTILYFAIGLALFAAAAGYLSREPLLMTGVVSGASVIKILKLAATMLVLVFILYGVLVSFENLHFHHRQALPEDRARIDWIYATMLIAGIILVSVSPLWWAMLLWLIPYMEAKAIVPPGPVLFLAPTIIAVELFVTAFVAALALSIFYKGAVDPRLAAHKLTVFGLLGLVVAFLFVLLERTVALKIVAFFGLSPDTGALLAGAAVAATIAPVKNRAEKAVNLFVGRFLPLDSLVDGERKVLTVAISDLSGYTALSAKDEKQALLLAALLQRQAARLTEAHGGRIVKSMGDAVMFAFDDADSAVTVLTALHHDFTPAAAQLGVEPLQVHSGAHTGEVTVAQDGDIYGQTVNIAARIQGSAAPGQIVVSESVAAAASPADYRDLGFRQFKNVPEAIPCRELLAAVASTHAIAGT